jgi:hypothetical protein
LQGIEELYNIFRNYANETTANPGKTENEEFWRAQWEDESVTGIGATNFWRPINMEAPVNHYPLTVLDPTTVENEDIIDCHIKGLGDRGRTW